MDLEALPAAITTEADARLLGAWCLRLIGLGFHPDTDAAEYVHVDTGEPLFDSATAERLNRLIIEALERDNFYGVCMDLIHQQNQPDDTAPGPPENSA